MTWQPDWGGKSVSPIYDVTCTTLYADLSRDMVLGIGRHRRIDQIDVGNFRLYCTDVSLLLAMRDFSLKQAIAEGTLAGNTKGGLYESFVADALLKSGHGLHFYRNESTRREVDFLIQREGSVVPMEVKAGSASANSEQSQSKGVTPIDRSHATYQWG